MRPTFSLILALLSFLVVGCGGKSPEMAPVTGRITMNDEPLIGAKVTFQPIAQEGNIDPGPGSWAETDSEGNYSLKMVGSNRAGAVVGEHRVEISLIDRSVPVKDDDRTRMRNLVPGRYNFQSDLVRTVPPEGVKDLDFKLTNP
jgi:hypothetical protein